MPRGPSRPKQWAAAVSACEAALSNLEEAHAALEAAAADLRSVQEEYENWKDNLPENLANSPLAEKLDAVCELQIEDIASNVESAVSEARDVISEAEGIDLPQGFGRD